MDIAGPDYEAAKVRLFAMFSEMDIDVPSDETDLFDSGILDSQRLVELLFQIERDFNFQVKVEDFEIENFRRINTIAALILDRKSSISVLNLPKSVVP